MLSSANVGDDDLVVLIAFGDSRTGTVGGVGIVPLVMEVRALDCRGECAFGVRLDDDIAQLDLLSRLEVLDGHTDGVVVFRTIVVLQRNTDGRGAEVDRGNGDSTRRIIDHRPIDGGDLRVAARGNDAFRLAVEGRVHDAQGRDREVERLLIEGDVLHLIHQAFHNDDLRLRDVAGVVDGPDVVGAVVIVASEVDVELVSSAPLTRSGVDERIVLCERAGRVILKENPCVVALSGNLGSLAVDLLRIGVSLHFREAVLGVGVGIHDAGHLDVLLVRMSIARVIEHSILNGRDAVINVGDFERLDGDRRIEGSSCIVGEFEVIPAILGSAEVHAPQAFLDARACEVLAVDGIFGQLVTVVSFRIAENAVIRVILAFEVDANLANTGVGVHEETDGRWFVDPHILGVADAGNDIVFVRVDARVFELNLDDVLGDIGLNEDHACVDSLCIEMCAFRRLVEYQRILVTEPVDEVVGVAILDRADRTGSTGTADGHIQRCLRRPRIRRDERVVVETSFNDRC